MSRFLHPWSDRVRTRKGSNGYVPVTAAMADEIWAGSGSGELK